ncbi:MAG: glycosyltransferase [Candidatus Sericytochromatia bacterium]|nr:glycosyltransferase [Candidatus Sericytochromatia bacterium]
MASTLPSASGTRITLLLPSLAGGGAERVFLTLLQHLDRQRFAPELVLLNGGPPEHDAALPADIPVTALERPRAREAPLALLAHLRRARPAAVVTTLGHMNLLLATLRPVLPKRMKLIGRETNMVSEAIAAGFMPRWMGQAYRFGLPGLDHLVCQSAMMRADLVDHFGFPGARASVIPNPVDLEVAQQAARESPWSAAKGGLRLVAAGRLERIKGFDLLVDALERCGDLPLTLEIHGEGPERETLQRHIDAAGLQERVRLRGFTPALQPWLAAADGFVLSSRVDSFPNAAIEALACGTPVIAVPAPGGIREIIADVPGCELADAVSAEALAAALRRWAARGPQRVGPEAVARYEVGQVVRQYEAVIESVIRSPRR